MTKSRGLRWLWKPVIQQWHCKCQTDTDENIGKKMAKYNRTLAKKMPLYSTGSWVLSAMPALKKNSYCEHN